MAIFLLRFMLLAAFPLFLEPVLATNISAMSLTDTDVLCYEWVCNSITDFSCICSDESVAKLWSCMEWNATSDSDYYISLRLLDRDCGIPRRVDTIDPDYLGAGIATFVVQTLFFGLRITSRVMGVGQWGWDDFTCGLAYITLMGQFIMSLFLNYYRFYTPFWTLDLWKIPYFLRLDFSRALVYAVGLGLSKMSILCLYQRLFPGPRPLKRILLGTQIFNILLVLSYIISLCLVARPFGCQFWLDPPANCSYHDVWDASGAYSAVNAALDIWMVVIPAVMVWRLQMKTARKLGVITILSTGALTCLIAIARFVLYRLNWTQFSDPVYQALIWTNYYIYYVELTTCFVIACLPASRQLVGQKFWPEVKSRMGTITAWTWSSGRSGVHCRENNTNDTTTTTTTKLISIAISKPADRTFSTFDESSLA